VSPNYQETRQHGNPSYSNCGGVVSKKRKIGDINAENGESEDGFLKPTYAL
jgi:hypothetical protein